MEDFDKPVYDQDFSNYRYQDQLKWSRFKIISIIEGAFLLGAFKAGITPVQSIALSIAGSLLVFTVSLLAIKDEYDADSFLDRIKETEKKWKITKFTSKSPAWLNGKWLMRIAFIILNTFNVLVVLHLAFTR